MSIQTTKSGAIQVVRWIALPVAPLLGAAVGAGLLALIQWFAMKISGGYSEDGWMYRYILPVFTSGSFGWLFATITCAIAPRGKVIAGIVMTTLLVLLGIVNVIFAWALSKFSLGEAIQTTASVIALSTSAIITLVHIYSEQESEVEA